MEKLSVQEASKFIAKSIKSEMHCGIVLGTGLSSLVDAVDVQTSIDYRDIPYFPIPTVEHHDGKLVVGKLSGKNIMVFQGRFHYYEGYSMKQITLPIRVLGRLGIKNVIICNIAGGLDPKHKKGDVMLINDHINLHYDNPLRGHNIEKWGERFPDMFEPYNFGFIKKVKQIATEHKLKIHEGVYVSVPGPNLETRAEYRYLRTIGADVVGMSTVPEVIVAAHEGIKVLAMSGITDLCTPESIKPTDIQEIISSAGLAQEKMNIIVKSFLSQL